MAAEAERGVKASALVFSRGWEMGEGHLGIWDLWRLRCQVGESSSSVSRGWERRGWNQGSPPEPGFRGDLLAQDPQLGG